MLFQLFVSGKIQTCSLWNAEFELRKIYLFWECSARKNSIQGAQISINGVFFNSAASGAVFQLGMKGGKE